MARGVVGLAVAIIVSLSPRRCAIRRSNNQRSNTRSPRRNDQIRVSPVRVVGADGEQVGVLETHEALRMAEEAGLDLVEVAATARPPVCRIMDYGKFRFEQQKAERERRRKATDNTPREIRFRPATDEHDLQVKVAKARELLEGGNMVRLTVRFRGRELRRSEVGQETLARAASMLMEVGKLQNQVPVVQGRSISVVMAPAN